MRQKIGFARWMAGAAIGMICMAATPAFAAGVGLTVKGELEKERTSDKTEGERTSSKTSTETAAYTLDIQVSNPAKQEVSFDVEWYFISQPLNEEGDEGDPILCEKGNTTLAIGPQKRAGHQAISKPLSKTETKTTRESSGNNDDSDRSDSSKHVSGDVYAGYVVLVKYEGKVVAQKASETKFGTPEWLEKLAGEVQAISGTKAASASGGKKKKKSDD